MQAVQLSHIHRVYLSAGADRGTDFTRLEDRRASDTALTGGTSFGNKGPLSGPFSVPGLSAQLNCMCACPRRIVGPGTLARKLVEILPLPNSQVR
jgi:hypothetical protein